MLDFPVLSKSVPAEPAKSCGERAGSIKTPNGAASKAPASSFAIAREDLEIRVETKDGDVLEIRRSLTVAAAYSRGGSRPGHSKAEEAPSSVPGEAGVEAAEGAEKGGLAGAREWVREISRELERQHVRLLERMLKEGQGEEAGRAGESRIALFAFVLVGPESAGKGECVPESSVPDYWNAENTSDRIVAFATSFAGIHGDSEFAETIRNAVLEGFEQAGAVLGELPGAAGKLNRDTKDLVFAKLEKWLDAWEAGAYNQGAQNNALQPALEA